MKGWFTSYVQLSLCWGVECLQLPDLVGGQGSSRNLQGWLVWKAGPKKNMVIKWSYDKGPYKWLKIYWVISGDYFTPISGGMGGTLLVHWFFGSTLWRQPTSDNKQWCCLYLGAFLIEITWPKTLGDFDRQEHDPFMGDDGFWNMFHSDMPTFCLKCTETVDEQSLALEIVDYVISVHIYFTYPPNCCPQNESSISFAGAQSKSRTYETTHFQDTVDPSRGMPSQKWSWT